jgi:predicted transport protein
LFLKLNPETVELEKGFIRDMRSIGHYGTGDLQIIIKTTNDFEKAKPLLERAYHEA